MVDIYAKLSEMYKYALENDFESVNELKDFALVYNKETYFKNNKNIYDKIELILPAITLINSSSKIVDQDMLKKDVEKELKELKKLLKPDKTNI